MTRFLYTLLLFLAVTSSTLAQDFLKAGDLSTVNVDQLTNTEIAKIQAQLQANKMTLEMAEPLALSKGMSAGEFAKLKVRLQSLEVNSEVITPQVAATVKKEEIRKIKFS